MTRPCGCPGAKGAPHLDDAARAKLKLSPCPRRGARSGPSGKHTDATSTPRLPRDFANAALAVHRAGRSDEGTAALLAILEKRR